jgi:hypothetical protein
MPCTHQACTCVVTEGEFCSEACRTMETRTPVATPAPDSAHCGCGHPGCAAAPAEPV